MSRLHISRSNNLENTGRTDTGQQFENTISSPDLRIGTTFANFNSEGKRPLLNDLLHIWVNGVLILSFIFFTASGFTSSHPAELSLKLLSISKLYI